MKKILYFASAIAVCITFSCHSDPGMDKNEADVLQEWGNNWCGSSDTFRIGMQELDDYLKQEGFLDDPSGDGRVKFLENGNSIMIPKNAPGYWTMKQAVYGSSQLTPDISLLNNVIDRYIGAHIGEYDASSAVHKFYDAVRSSGKSVDPEPTTVFHSLAALSETEVENHPLIRDYLYLLNTYGNKQMPKITFEYVDTGEPFDINLPPVLPPPAPVDSTRH